MKRFIIEQSFWDLFPDAHIGIVVAEGLQPAEAVRAAHDAEIGALLAQENREALRFLPSHTISENEVVAVWRDAYQKFKTKKGARSSIENLLKRVSKGNEVGRITPLVDLYNAVSLRYALPCGGEDIDTFVGDLRLRVTQGGDVFRALGDAEDSPTLPGEVSYLDDVGAVCRCWNWRDGQRTMLTDTTQNAFLIVECVDPQRGDDARAATEDLAQLIQRYCGATLAQVQMLSKEVPQVQIQG
ncbi:MAG: B3/4 domain-containing protein [Raoultibacter sp.]